jgi:hypothetical protein
MYELFAMLFAVLILSVNGGLASTGLTRWGTAAGSAGMALGCLLVLINSRYNLDFLVHPLIARAIEAPPPTGLQITSATYGENCGTAPGNATRDVAESCNGKQTCDYVVDIDRLGDPAPRCDKNYAVEYSCDPDATPLREELPGEAGLKSLLKLSCSTSLAAATQFPKGLQIRSATYGGNCGAAVGNATNDLIKSCGGKADCVYRIYVQRLGDPAPGCSKDFRVEYSCSPEAPLRTNVATPEAGFGSVLQLCQ